MSALPDLSAHFVAMERLMEAQPEDVRAEIARGVYAMSPRPSGWHGLLQVRLSGILDGALGPSEGKDARDWLFLMEPEIRSPETFSRLVPDVAGWRRSTTGWPDLDVTPIPLAPDWVAEILSPGTESFDRGPKRDAYGLMGVGWLWLVDPVRRTVQTFTNVRGKMVTGSSFAAGQTIAAPPFAELSIPPTQLFPPI